ncbi:hypothetical protein ACFQ1S_21445, partial [Kibdelosporangium lantanae]
MTSKTSQLSTTISPTSLRHASSVRHVVTRALTRYRDRVAIRGSEGAWTYGELEDRAGLLAAGLRHELRRLA